MFRIIALLLLSTSVYASNCPDLYPLPISIPNTIELCNTNYVSLVSSDSNRVILTSEKYSSAPKINANSNFREDTRLDKTTRAKNSDYYLSGYDRGHLVPAENSTSITALRESYLLSNATPQVPNLNRGRWAQLERNVRLLKPKYIITGALYTDNKTIGTSKIMVPSAYYKCAYLADSSTSCWISLNTSGSALPASIDISVISNTTNIRLQ
jgi:endonuclease G